MGEVSLAADFPHWRLYRFYLATFASGCLGGAQLVCAFNLRRFILDSTPSSSSPSSSSPSSSSPLLSSLSSSSSSALTLEWKRMIGELNAAAKTLIAIISFAYCSWWIFPYADGRNSSNDFGVLAFCCLSLAMEFGFYRLQSTLPSIPFHFLRECRLWIKNKVVASKKMIIVA